MTPYVNNTSKRRRAGFSLIEILVVVGIIGLLAAMSLMAYRGFIGGARVRATQTTIRKIDELLHKRMDAFNRWLDSMHVEAPGRPEYVLASDYTPLSAMGINPGDPAYRDVAMVIARKNRFREYFPQNIIEVPTNPDFPGAVSPTEVQNAECLYYLIMQSQVFGVEPVEDGFFQATEFGDTDGDGLMEFLDNWGNPIRFYRWPTYLVPDANANLLMGSIAMTVPIDGPDNAPGSPGDDDGLNGADDPNEFGWPMSDDPINDPDDPNGFVPDLLLQLSTNGTPWDFQGVSTPSISVLPYHTPAMYHAPLLVSAGPDGSGPGGGGLGLYEPEDIAAYGHLAQPITGQEADLTDNITNLNSRTGGP